MEAEWLNSTSQHDPTTTHYTVNRSQARPSFATSKQVLDGDTSLPETMTEFRAWAREGFKNRHPELGGVLACLRCQEGLICLRYLAQ